MKDYMKKRKKKINVFRLKGLIEYPAGKRKIDPHADISLGHFTMPGIRRRPHRRSYRLPE